MINPKTNEEVYIAFYSDLNLNQKQEKKYR